MTPQRQPHQEDEPSALPGFGEFTKTKAKAKGQRYSDEELRERAEARSRANSDEWRNWSIWRRLIRDARISKGACWLWHYLRDVASNGYVNNHHCSVRNIARWGRCKNESVLKWIDELVAAGWLAVHRSRFGNEYRILNGFQVWVQNFGDKRQLDFNLGIYTEGKWFKISKDGVVTDGDDKIVTVPSTGNTTVPSTGNTTVPSTGNSNVSQDVKPECKGDDSPLSAMQDWQIKKDLKENRDELALERKQSRPDPNRIIYLTSQVASLKAEQNRRGKLQPLSELGVAKAKAPPGPKIRRWPTPEEEAGIGEAMRREAARTTAGQL